MKFHPLRLLAALLLLTIGSVLPGVPQAQAAETIRINGSGSAISMLKPLISAYRRTHPDLTIVMDKPLGSSGAIKALLAGALDIAASSKPLKSEEVSRGAIANEYGKTPMVIITEKSVKKSNITTKELEDIFAGRTSKWPDGEQIRVVLRPEADIDTTILRTLSNGMSQAIDTARSHPGMIVAVTDPEASQLVSRTRGAIGASTAAGIIDDKLPLNVLSLNGVKGTTSAYANGNYPLAKDIRFITTARTHAEARKFLEFVYSPQGRSIAAKAGVLVSDKANLTR